MNISKDPKAKEKNAAFVLFFFQIDDNIYAWRNIQKDIHQNANSIYL